MLSSLLSLHAARRRGIFYLSYSNYTIHQARIHNHRAVPFLLFSSHALFEASNACRNQNHLLLNA